MTKKGRRRTPRKKKEPEPVEEPVETKKDPEITLDIKKNGEPLEPNEVLVITATDEAELIMLPEPVTEEPMTQEAEAIPEVKQQSNNGDKEKPLPQFDSITLQYVQLAAVCRDLPEPVLAPTAKEYGEHFYPAYSTTFNRIRKLLD